MTKSELQVTSSNPNLTLASAHPEFAKRLECVRIPPLWLALCTKHPEKQSGGIRTHSKRFATFVIRHSSFGFFRHSSFVIFC
jgi:hypothetical protein